MISSFCSRKELDAAMNDELQPPFAEAELVDPDLLPDIPSADVTWMQEYENRLAHVNAFVQAQGGPAGPAPTGRAKTRKGPPA